MHKSIFSVKSRNRGSSSSYSQASTDYPYPSDREVLDSSVLSRSPTTRVKSPGASNRGSSRSTNPLIPIMNLGRSSSNSVSLHGAHQDTQGRASLNMSELSRSVKDQSSSGSGGSGSGGEERQSEESPAGLPLHAGNTRMVFARQPNDYCDNFVKNTKYTVINFIPKSLLLQFSQHMNRYFLLVSCLQLFPQLTPVNPLTTWLPLLFIFSVTMVKEAFDDYRRWKDDRAANGRLCTVVRDRQHVRIPRRDIRVGDIVYLTRDEEIPCDVVVLKTNSQHGTCYIETANIDGETNLKDRMAIQETQELSPVALRDFLGVVECSLPNKHIYSFDARLRVTPRSQPIGISFEQLLPQATFLRNTDWAYSLAVYTGDETKLGKNKKSVPNKLTNLDHKINRTTVAIFGLMIVTFVAMGIAGNIMRNTRFNMIWTYRDFTRKWWESMVIPLRFFLLMSLMIPISLKVSLDLAKLFYSYLINQDLQMYDAKSDTPANAANTAISEDLGEIDYILTDKTGTLTENEMAFKQCSIGKHRYGDGQQSIYEDESLLERVHDDHSTNLFFRTLALCNTVVPSVRNGKIEEYSASSPDEEALVVAASRFGVALVYRDTEELKIDDNGDEDTYQILQVLPFDSDRKRMSILLQHKSTRTIHLFSKGADDMILARLREDFDDMLRFSMPTIDGYAKSGLRTLCIAHREVGQHEYRAWKEQFDVANADMLNRDRSLNEIYDLMEHSLTLVGLTAIEDKLQDQVPETIATLREANIRFWMLTGDKAQTAREIARSCKMVSEEGEILAVEGSSTVDIGVSLRRLEERLFRMSKDSEVSLLVEGSRLAFCLKKHREVFQAVCSQCETVICCRVTPSQKASVVAMVKSQGHTTLAIGDGGNDIGMIQEAQIGVGISGHEGLQAARAADYSFARFKFLTRLCLVHGRYSNNRTSFIAQYCFYKSMFIAFIQVLFGFISGFSGASLFDSLSLTCYNLFYTSLAPMVYCLEKDVHERTLMDKPELFEHSQSGRSYSLKTVALWQIRAIIQAAGISLIVFLSVTDLAKFTGQDRMALVAYTAVVFVQALTMALETTYFTAYNHVVIWGTFPLFFIINLIIGAIPSSETYGEFVGLIQDGNYWMGVLICTLATILPVVAAKYIKFWYWPSPLQIAQRRDKLIREGDKAPLLPPLLRDDTNENDNELGTYPL